MTSSSLSLLPTLTPKPAPVLIALLFAGACASPSTSGPRSGDSAETSRSGAGSDAPRSAGSERGGASESKGAPSGSKTRKRDAGAKMDRIAEEYVKLVLAVGEHDDGYVDAYYGPKEWPAEVKAKLPTVVALTKQTAALREHLEEVTPAAGPSERRKVFLGAQLRAVEARLAMLQGIALPFDRESKLLYDAVVPPLDMDAVEATLAELERIIPGKGRLADRYESWRAGFTIPKEKLTQVFDAALAEARRRTAEHLPLPTDEGFRFELVTDKPWSGYNWYQGDAHSLIQVNTDLPIYIERAIDLAAHEGYPGHHVFNALIEQRQVNERGWVEYTVYPLYSPQSLLAEGTAEYGIQLAFPGDEKRRFEREVLFPMAGLDPARADEFDAVQTLMKRLEAVPIEVARRYLDGKLDREEAELWMRKYALATPERAAQRLRFIDAYRSYIINYHHGQALVAGYVEAKAKANKNGNGNGNGNVDATRDLDARWEVFERLLAEPHLPSELARGSR